MDLIEKVDRLINKWSSFSQMEPEEYDQWFIEVNENMSMLSVDTQSAIKRLDKRMRRRFHNKLYARRRRMELATTRSSAQQRYDQLNAKYESVFGENRQLAHQILVLEQRLRIYEDSGFYHTLEIMYQNTSEGFIKPELV